MKILIAAGLFYPSKLGGPANTLYWFAKALISKNTEVSVVTSKNHIDENSIEFDKWIKVDGIRVRYCSTYTKLHLRILFNSIRELLKCDVVILSSFFYIPNFPIALCSVLLNKKVIWSPRGELFESAINRSKAKLFYVRIIKFFFAKKAIFHSTSTDECCRIKKYLGADSKIVIIPNYIELPYKQNRVEGKEYLLYLGRIAPIKALDKLLLGLAKSDSFIQSNFILLIAGGVENQFGDYYEKIQLIIQNKELLKNKIIFLGNVEGAEKYKLYANAFFTLLVSDSENFGNVVVESLSQGTPVIASKGTPWQKLEDKKAGFWINNNVEDIANCIDEVLKIENKEYQQIRNNAYNYGLEFDVHTNIDKWINVIKNHVTI